MTEPPPPPSLKSVYGKAFLIHLDRGDMEMARVFARAFLLSKNGPEEENAYS